MIKYVVQRIEFPFIFLISEWSIQRSIEAVRKIKDLLIWMDQDSGEIDKFVNIYFVWVLEKILALVIASGEPEVCRGKLFLVDQRPAERNYFISAGGMVTNTQDTNYSTSHMLQIILGPNFFIGGMLITNQNTNYNSWGMLITTQNANYSTRGMLQIILGTNYSIRGMLITTQDTNYSTERMLITTQDTSNSTRGWASHPWHSLLHWRDANNHSGH